MRLRKAIDSFNKFYKTKKRYVAARGEWSGAPELGLKSSELRRRSKRAGMSMNQYRKAMKRKKTKLPGKGTKVSMI